MTTNTRRAGPRFVGNGDSVTQAEVIAAYKAIHPEAARHGIKLPWPKLAHMLNAQNPNRFAHEINKQRGYAHDND